ncbi:hypothetical protein PENTCL1PPCAC_24464 [Pristionchus entomophagus]|uniref:Peptidase n=1 Tax=Pristionchus entomophagus TaxID=358040 RepID=A0AAV5U7C2_9BILA|nr:hypothetical protein PENTCL1PPCAC_24464 [Pristionchus entomophagus]
MIIIKLTLLLSFIGLSAAGVGRLMLDVDFENSSAEIKSLFFENLHKRYFGAQADQSMNMITPANLTVEVMHFEFPIAYPWYDAMIVELAKNLCRFAPFRMPAQTLWFERNFEGGHEAYARVYSGSVFKNSVVEILNRYGYLGDAKREAKMVVARVPKSSPPLEKGEARLPVTWLQYLPRLSLLVCGEDSDGHEQCKTLVTQAANC